MIRQFIPQQNEAELQLLKTAYLEMYNHPDALRYLSFTQLKFTDRQVSEWMRSHLDTGVDYHVYLDDDTSDINGISLLKSDPVIGFELLSLCVRSVQRRSGVGKQLVENSIQIAGEKGFKAVDAAVFADNKPMLHLMIKMDFRIVGIDYHKRADGMDLIKFVHMI